MCDEHNPIWYEAFKRKDARFDGQFFVGVKSTGVYCRPVCKARLPRPENCTFYASAAQAEQAGFRPCLLCRPELAPGMAPVDASANLAYKAARKIEENCADEASISEIARSLGCSDRHLRRAFAAEFHVSPVQYLQTCRLLLAKNLLTSSNLSVFNTAMAAGFGSLRRFNALFREKYHMTPSDLRRQLPATPKQADMIRVALGYRPPFLWEKLLTFFAQRAIAGVEVIQNNEYQRTVCLKSADNKNVCGWIKVGHLPEKNRLTVDVSLSLLPVLPQVLSRVRAMFDLYCDPQAIYDALKTMNEVKAGSCVLGTRLPGCFNVFEMSVRTILGQQVSIKAAQTLTARFIKALGTPLQSDIDGLTHIFPLPEQITALKEPVEDVLGKLGITGMRAKAIKKLAEVLLDGSIDLTFCATPENEIQKLQALPGVGPWTAQYLVMRALSWPDAFLDTDYGVKKALAPLTPKEIARLKEKWHPWGSYATINLWNTL